MNEWFSVQGLKQCSSKSETFNLKIEMKGYRFKRKFGRDIFECFLLTSSFLFISLSEYRRRHFPIKYSKIRKLTFQMFWWLWFTLNVMVKIDYQIRFLLPHPTLLSLKVNQVPVPCFKNWNCCFGFKDLQMPNWPVCLESGRLSTQQIPEKLLL